MLNYKYLCESMRILQLAIIHLVLCTCQRTFCGQKKLVNLQYGMDFSVLNFLSILSDLPLTRETAQKN